MDKLYTNNVYVLIQDNNEKMRFENYISKININYTFFNSIKFNDNDLLLLTKLRNIDNFTKHYFKSYLGKYKNYKLNRNQISHIKSIIGIIKDAFKNDYNSITILEYDIFVHKDINNLLPQYKNLINNCDIIYLGSSQHYWYNPINYTKINYHKNYYNANHSLGTFAIILKKKVYQIYLEYLEKFLFSSDIILSIISKNFKSIVIYPNLIICDISKSSILKDRNEKETLLKFKWNKYNYIN
uniref:Glycosyl transferase family 25 domain-containing protein n=1 Tax=viral metagenome TaxID=1070528 RepID=A0A6C0J5R9_9ZZZZ